MTIAANDGRISYTGDSSTTVFAYDFPILDEDHIEVYVNGALQTIGTHYSVSGVGDAGGGNITFVTAPGVVTVILLRATPVTQETDYLTGTKFPAETHEDALDKLTMIMQERLEELSRTIKLTPATIFSDLTFPDPVSQRLIRWKTDLSGFENVAVVDLALSDGTVITAKGDLVQGGNTGAPEVLAIGTADQVLKVVSGKAAWSSVPTHEHSGADVTSGTVAAARVALNPIAVQVFGG